jgi:CRISPR/Cas system-associated exonuclease Cas4 (RecB family)
MEFAKMICAAKAHLWDAKAKVAYAAVMNRNSQKWWVGKLTGNFAGANTIVEKRVEALENLLNGSLSAEKLDTIEPTMQWVDTKKDRWLRREKLILCDEAREIEWAKTDKDLHEFIDAVDEYFWLLNKKPHKNQDGAVHPSEVSFTKCDRRIAYGLLNQKRIPTISGNLRRIFDVGHCVHDVLQEIVLEEYPDAIMELPVRDDETKIKGHCDGRIGLTEGIEIKSMATKTFCAVRQSAKIDHRRQATIYAALSNLTTMHYIYYNKNSGDLKVLTHEVEKNMWESIKSRISDIITKVERGTLPGRIDKDWSCKSCPYMWTCRTDLLTENIQRLI